MSTESSATAQFISNAFGDTVLYDVNRDAFDRTGSAAVFQRHFGESLKREDSLFIIIGTDSTLLAQWLLKDDLPEGTRYLFIEPKSIIEPMRERLPQIEELPNVRLVTEDEWQDCAEAFQFQEYSYLDQVKVIQSIGAMDAYFTEYRRLFWDTQTTVKEMVWHVEFQLGSQAFVQRQIENIADNRDSAICLKNTCKGRTAVLLGGGPSLDELLPWIKQHRDAVTVIAVSRICRRLLEIDLQPDIVVSIDPHPVSFDVSKELLRFNHDTLLMHSFHITPLLLSQWSGPAVYYGERLPWKSKANDDNLVGQGPTVTNTALSMAVQLGFSQIVLAGVDLCYNREGHTHAAGSNERNAGPLLGNVGIQVETNGGWMADTRHSFASAVEIMGNQAKKALTHDCHIINPAAGSAKIPNVEHLPVDDIELPQDKDSAAEHLREFLPENNHSHRIAHLNRMLKSIANANGKLRAIKHLADDALECNDGLFGRNGKTADFKYKKRMDKIEKKLDREYKDISPLVKSFGSRRFLRLVRPDKDREWSDDDIEKWGRAYYEAYNESADALLEMLEDAQQRIRSRLDEDSDTPDVQALIKQWNADGAPGRALVWLSAHSDKKKTLNDLEQAALNNSINAFEDIMQETETEQAKWCSNNYTLAPVRSKLQILFQQQDREELVHTSDELKKNDSTEAIDLAALSDGYLAELDGDKESAMAFYNLLVDRAAEHMDENDGQLPRSPQLEDALRRMSGIALDKRDTDTALLLMSTLASISPSYESQYAELQRLTGDLQGAINTYADYLEKAPNDFGAMLKLGKIFNQVGVAESAIWAYNYVLEKDPNNQAAQTLLNELQTS